MNKIITGVAVAVIGSVLTLVAASPAFAWHPVGKIVKEVQNVTTGSVLSDANTTADAIAVKPGDTIKYVITVRNDGLVDDSGNNDMANTQMTDTLPVGVALANGATQITENLGLIKPGQKVVKEYTLKVTSQKNGDIITNEACMTGNSTVNDNPQHDCNLAVIKVSVPETPVTPTPPTPPVTPPTPQTPAELPKTGVETLVGATTGLGAITFAGASYIRSRRR